MQKLNGEFFTVLYPIMSGKKNPSDHKNYMNHLSIVGIKRSGGL